MAESNVIKVIPSVQLKEFIQNQLVDTENIPERIRQLSNPQIPLRKRGGKATLSLPETTSQSLLHAEDFHWLYNQVKKLRESGNESSGIFLHKLLEGCEIVLPQPPVTERNPELEARIQRLKKEQEDREYKAMTKNVDNVRIRHPDDSIGYQMKMINSHIIAVVQFIVSVGAGFTFGFLGVQLMVGSLDFGFRLLLGVACALTIALAEIYFLAKKLSEEYEDVAPLPVQSVYSATKQIVSKSSEVSAKQHRD
ncbi:Transmembrane protein 199 [Frankliniella fusca]|uniref:Transmembrane protein 199 n=1 Tax=Frankliniella fusca TaxID=407009 RepID=A0AAE1HQZ6_9NEOP|nr:Transmembrane protein 199 [Frankliniella fusca]